MATNLRITILADYTVYYKSPNRQHAHTCGITIFRMAFFENAFFVHGSSFECTLVEVLVVEERRAAFSCFYSYCL